MAPANASFDPIRLMGSVLGLRGLARRATPAWLFLLARLVVRVELCLLSPQSRRSLQPLFQVLRPKFGELRIVETAKRHCLIRKWRRYLLKTWPAWAQGNNQWFEFVGRDKLNAVLKQGKGTLLLSPHGFGFAAFVAPILAQSGYRVHRVGLGWQGNDISELWGKGDYKRWEHIHYRWESWKNIEALRKIKTALEQNEIVHVSVRGQSSGEARFEIPFWYEKYFLDAPLLRAMEFFQAPVIPCFSRLDDYGKVIFVLYGALAPNADTIVAEFGALYLSWLEERPELSRIWKRVLQQRTDW